MAKSTDISRGVVVQAVGTGHAVVNNLIVYAASGTNNAAFCVDTSGLTIAGAFTTFDYNQCYHAAAWTSAYQSLATWQATSGAPDTHSLMADPLLVGTPIQASPGNTGIGSASPAKGAGTAVNMAKRDLTTCARPSPPSIGAYEYFASPCGTKPASSPSQLQ